jgi:endonuclease-3
VDKTKEFFEYCRELFGDTPKCELDFTNDIECLVAIILSAQCTDKRTNAVTRELFKKYKTIADFAVADQQVFEREIFSTGFYHNKAKNIIAMAKAVDFYHGGKIPADIETLTTLPGVGRKTANVFLTEWHHLPGLGVDTHVTRVANRLGYVNTKNAEKIEKELKSAFAEKDWGKFHLYMVLFGRYHCKAVRPNCADCKIKHLCGGVKK